MKKIASFFIFFEMAIICISQAQTPLLNTAPLSPDAGSMAKYTDIPVQMSTGIPNISIPLYNYSGTNGLQAQIGLSYYAGGVKVSDPGSSVGIGWSLSSGGVISRLMKGRPDNPAVGYDGSRNLSSGSICFGVGFGDCPGGFNPQKDDWEADIFSYSFNGNSGRFMTPSGSAPVLMPQGNVKITYNSQTQSFEALDNKGVKYIFGAREYLLDEAAIISWSGDGIAQPTSNDYYISSWYLTKIVSPTLSDTITFEYTAPYPALETNYYTTKITSSKSFNPQTEIKVKYQAVSLTKITFPNKTQITFNYGDRTDLPNGKYLAKMTVNGIRTFEFKYKYLNSRLTLTGLQESAGDYSKPSYSLQYNEGTLPPRTSFAQDYWGYYNGANNNEQIYYPNGLPNGGTVANNMLTSIQYPTGSITDFVFEPNDAHITDQGIGYKLIGGLRIKRIRSRIPGTSTVQTKEYTYKTAAGLSSGTCPGYVQIAQPTWLRDQTYTPETNPFYYSRVEVKDSAGPGKIVYNYNAPFAGYVPAGETSPLPATAIPNWSTDNLSSKEIYDNAGRVVEKTANEYNYFYQSFKGYTQYDSYKISVYDNGIYNGTKYSQATGRIELKNTKTTRYTYTGSNTQPDNVLEEKTSFEYDTIEYNLKKTVLETGSDVLTTTYVYPYNIAGPVYTSMKGRNMIGTPIDVIATRFNVQTGATYQVKRVKTEYMDYNADGKFLLPSKTYTINGPGDIAADNITQIYQTYSPKGRLLDAYKPGGLLQTTLWGYDQQYPVAKIEGASFNTTLSRINNYNEIVRPSNDSSLRSQLAILRNQLPDAQISGYTYDKEGHVSSETDVNGRTTYYEYDDFGRIVYVRDQYKNILKGYCYEYNGTKTECNKLYYSNEIAGQYLRKNDCTEGQYGALIQMPSVPYGKYKSMISQEDADAKARVEANTYNQAYANSHYSCQAAGKMTCNNTSGNIGILLYSPSNFSWISGSSDAFSCTVSGNSIRSFDVPPGFYNVYIAPVSDVNCNNWWSSYTACNIFPTRYQYFRFAINTIPWSSPVSSYPPAGWGVIPNGITVSGMLGAVSDKYGGYYESAGVVWVGPGFSLDITVRP